MKIFRKAKVFVNNIYAGVLSECHIGYQFVYLDEYLLIDNAKPVSITLPLSKLPYKSRKLFSFFDGLIPEGTILDKTIKVWNIKPTDRFGVLLVSCKDSIGNITLEEI